MIGPPSGVIGAWHRMNPGCRVSFAFVGEGVATEEGNPRAAGGHPALEQGVSGVALVVAVGDDAVYA